VKTAPGTICDFVIVGFRDGLEEGGQFRVAASDRLTEGEIKAIFEEGKSWQEGPLHFNAPGRVHYEIQVVTEDSGREPILVFTWGESYAEAIVRLFEFWQPTEPEAKELTP
jgi:hypothetical protein